jgi:hypothetical protein
LTTSVVDAAPSHQPPTSRRRARTIPAATLLIAATFLAFPLVIAMISLVGYRWHPV